MDDIKRVTGLALAMRKQAMDPTLQRALLGIVGGGGLGALSGYGYSKLVPPPSKLSETEKKDRTSENTWEGAISGAILGGVGLPALLRMRDADAAGYIDYKYKDSPKAVEKDPVVSMAEPEHRPGESPHLLPGGETHYPGDYIPYEPGAFIRDSPRYQDPYAAFRRQP